MTEKLFIIDGSNILFRAFYGIRAPLKSADGRPTNAVYGFTRMLLELIRNHNPHYLTVAFDPPGPSFRRDIYPLYKANRDAPPEDLVPQFTMVREMVSALKIPLIEKAGYEADDMIGAAAKMFEEHGFEVVIVSGDKDLMQLVDERTSVLDTMKNIRYTPVEVKEKFGVEPRQVTDVLGLAGDTSDNIPGIPGIGEKTAAALIQQFGDLETVLASVDKISGKKRKENLVEFADQARLSKKLATIETAAPLELSLEDLAYTAPELSQVLPILREFNFKSIIVDLFGDEGETTQAEQPGPISSPPADETEKNYTCVDDLEKFEAMLVELKKCDRIAYDCETTSLEPMRAELVGISFASAPGRAWYIPVAHRYIGAPPLLPLKKVLPPLAELFASPDKSFIAQNGKYDMLVLRRAGFESVRCDFDSMIASYVLDSDRAHGLDAMALEYFGHRMIPYSEVTGKGRNQITFDGVEIERATEYAAEDADFTLRIAEKLRQQMIEEGLMELFENLEMPLLSVLVDMEAAGVKIDINRLGEMSSRFEEAMNTIAADICAIAGEEFNINSPLQLSEVLFEKMGIETKGVSKTKSGGYSTNQEVLEKLAVDQPIADKVLEYRGMQKLKSTYVDALPELINRKTGRIHTSYNPARTATGRLSSSNPNLQNIPIRGEEGKRIRQAFIAEEGAMLVGADYSQIELRLLAHFSGEPELVDAFKSGTDIHSKTAELIFGRPAEEITPDERSIAKTINFSVLYGKTPYGLSRQMNIPVGDAKRFIDDYFNHYGAVRSYFDLCIEQALADGYVSTLFGRRRYLPEIKSKNRAVREHGERMAINTPIQGTAADLIKKAMINLHPKLGLEFPAARMIMQVHDELVVEAPRGDCENVAKLIKREMESALELSVELVVEVSIGNNWNEAH